MRQEVIKMTLTVGHSFLFFFNEGAAHSGSCRDQSVNLGVSHILITTAYELVSDNHLAECSQLPKS